MFMQSHGGFAAIDNNAVAAVPRPQPRLFEVVPPRDGAEQFWLNATPALAVDIAIPEHNVWRSDAKDEHLVSLDKGPADLG
jgi:hypothetical protein